MPASPGRGPRAVAFVVKGWPRLSETFIAQEVEGLEARGLDIRLVSLRHPTDKARHPVHDAIRAPISYLPEYLYQEPVRVLKCLVWCIRSLPPGRLRRATAMWWRDLRRDISANRVRRFGQALVLGAELPEDVVHLHAHFMHTPGSVARYAAALRGMRFSLSAHARDIYTIGEWEKREKLADCDWLVTCTAANVEHLSAIAPRADTVALQYHGLQLGRFSAPAANGAPSTEIGTADAFTIISVGRAVAKKGYDVLLDALAALPRGLDWRFVHIGGGALRDALKRQAAALGIAQRIEWCGAMPQQEVIERLRAADVFALASIIDEDGDRDGLPNVLMEAQSQRLACVATDISGIPELIEHERTGLLVPSGAAAPLTSALARLAGDPDLRERLAVAGEARVRDHFDAEAGLDLLYERFQQTLGQSDADRP